MATTQQTATKAAGFPVDGAQTLREAAETGSAQTKQAFEQMSVAAADATKLINDTCSTAAKGLQDYNAKFMEFTQANIGAALTFFEQLKTVKSPSEFFELSSSHSRKQFETLTEQARELATLGEKAALATAERVQTDVSKAYSQRS